MAGPTFEFTAEVWRWEQQAAWHFVSLPADVADEIEAGAGQRAGGFGSVPVTVTIGGSTWRTSVFPDRRRATYVLPVKQAVRAAEGIGAGDAVAVTLTVRA